MKKEINLEKRKKRASLRDEFQLHLMALPGIVSMFCFHYWPLYGLLLAFKSYTVDKGIIGSEWVGMHNFEFLWNGQYAGILVRNTLGYNITFLILGTVLAIILALLLNELHSKKFAKVVQTIYIMPNFLSITAIAIVVQTFLSYGYGSLTNLFETITGTRPQFYFEEKWWPFFFVIINIWQGVGYRAIVYLATIAGISKEYYEAAMLDGASKFQQAWYITIPQMRTIISVLLIMSLGGIFSGDFGLFYSVPLDPNRIYHVTFIMDTYVYFAFQNLHNIGMSVAAGMFQSVVGLIFLLGANKIVSMIEPDNALF